MDEQAFRDLAAAEGYSEPVEVTWDIGYSMDEHIHDFDAKLFVLRGQISATANGETTTCGPGDSFDYTAGTIHTEAAGPDGAVFLAARKAD